MSGFAGGSLVDELAEELSAAEDEEEVSEVAELDVAELEVATEELEVVSDDLEAAEAEEDVSDDDAVSLEEEDVKDEEEAMPSWQAAKPKRLDARMINSLLRFIVSLLSLNFAKLYDQGRIRPNYPFKPPTEVFSMIVLLKRQKIMTIGRRVRMMVAKKSGYSFLVSSIAVFM